MKTTRCQFCHEEIPTREYDAHVAEHLKLQEDGQQEEYATLPPEERDDIDISNEPQSYLHEKCGFVTGMPEEIIRTYLVNPYFYLADRSFCCGCGQHIPCRELVWVETGENLQDYNDRLRAAKPELRPGLLKRAFFAVVRALT